MAPELQRSRLLISLVSTLTIAVVTIDLPRPLAHPVAATLIWPVVVVFVPLAARRYGRTD